LDVEVHGNTVTAHLLMTNWDGAFGFYYGPDLIPATTWQLNLSYQDSDPLLGEHCGVYCAPGFVFYESYFGWANPTYRRPVHIAVDVDGGMATRTAVNYAVPATGYDEARQDAAGRVRPYSVQVTKWGGGTVLVGQLDDVSMGFGSNFGENFGN
jgi:hypothetical protein